MKSFKILMMAALSIISISVIAQQKAGKKDSNAHSTFYSCSMHDTVAMKKPGNCPVCGMKLQTSTKEQMKAEITRQYTCPTHLTVISNKAGKCNKCGAELTLSAKEQMKMEAVKAYICPMKCEADKTYNNPGKCPKCGMGLKEKIEAHSNHNH